MNARSVVYVCGADMKHAWATVRTGTSSSSAILSSSLALRCSKAPTVWCFKPAGIMMSNLISVNRNRHHDRFPVHSDMIGIHRIASRSVLTVERVPSFSECKSVTAHTTAANSLRTVTAICSFSLSVQDQ